MKTLLLLLGALFYSCSDDTSKIQKTNTDVNVATKKVSFAKKVTLPYLTQNDANKTRPLFISLHLECNATTLNVGEEAKLTLVGTSKDNSTKVLTQGIEYTITPGQNIDIDSNSTVHILKDGHVTIQAKVGNTLSNKIVLDNYWVVNGYKLPPEPNETLNNSTLLGIDSNHNGVRDDVERWIYHTRNEYIPCRQETDYNNSRIIDGEIVYSAMKVCEKHPVSYRPVIRVLEMHVAKEAQIIIQDPSRARVTDINFSKAYLCASVVGDLKDQKGRRLSDKLVAGKDFIKIQFNTVKRARAYSIFNYYLSGRIYNLPTDDFILKNWCPQDIREMIPSFLFVETINGHGLPPEPDPKINNSTLLGVDVNNNGVRDDVERWIYQEYKDRHPIYADIAMQAAKAYRLVLEHPERARDIHKVVRKPFHCQSYYKNDAKYLNETVLVKENIVNEFFREEIFFNTQKRMDAYDKYNHLLSGGSYALPSFKEEKKACDFDTSKYSIPKKL